MQTFLLGPGRRTNLKLRKSLGGGGCHDNFRTTIRKSQNFHLKIFDSKFLSGGGHHIPFNPESRNQIKFGSTKRKFFGTPKGCQTLKKICVWSGVFILLDVLQSKRIWVLFGVNRGIFLIRLKNSLTPRKNPSFC